MEHEVKLVARTIEVNENEVDIDQINYELTVLSGKAAGVCYMPDNYMEDGIQNVDKALKRAENTSRNGHHSVFDHGHVTLCIKTSKMMCMILNSLGVYATSEKSARYTIMKPETELELNLYNKWKGIIKKLILDKYSNIDDEILNTRLCKELGIQGFKLVHNGKILVDFDTLKVLNSNDKILEIDSILKKLKESDTLPSSKLAQENARYMISVFTPTTMLYTISFRQLFLTADYLDKLVINCKKLKVTNFNNKLIEHAEALSKQLKEVAGQVRIEDTKGQYIRFLEYQHMVDFRGSAKSSDFHVERIEGYTYKVENIADSYTLHYKGSLAMLAQAQRHRTIRYSMSLREAGDFGFYVPPIVYDAELDTEWLSDIESISYCVPQGTLVTITEQGLFEDFALKCKERMCGRAQLEIMKSTEDSIKKFLSNKNNLCNYNRMLLNRITDLKDKPCARCLYHDFKCTDKCNWGANGALTRLI